MVLLPQNYCIDSTEVTRSQYQTWLSSNPNPSSANLPTYCQWKSSFVPDPDCMTSSSPPVCTSNCSAHPQVCVDWCDAYAYCKAAGKHLCGKIGGGSSPLNAWSDASQNEWYNACSSNGQNTYPYGSTYDADKCDGYDHGLHTSVPTTSMSGCQSSVSGYVGVFDMSGNAIEWEDSCDGNTGSADRCRVRGGPFCEGYDLYCAADVAFDRDFHCEDSGFRCCADAVPL
jgi:formylglycine-generating enzyme